MSNLSPASRDRVRRLDQALAEARVGRERNRAAATQLPPSHKGGRRPGRSGRTRA